MGDFLYTCCFIGAFFCAHPIYRHLNLTSAQLKKKARYGSATILQIKRESKGHKKYAILATETKKFKKKGALARYSVTQTYTEVPKNFEQNTHAQYIHEVSSPIPFSNKVTNT
jgi:hypothetical protein